MPVPLRNVLRTMENIYQRIFTHYKPALVFSSLSFIKIKMFDHHILALKMNYNVFTICRKITETLLGLEFTI